MEVSREKGLGEVIDQYVLDHWAFFRPNHIYVLYRCSENLTVFYKVAQGAGLGRNKTGPDASKGNTHHPSNEKNKASWGKCFFPYLK